MKINEHDVVKLNDGRKDTVIHFEKLYDFAVTLLVILLSFICWPFLLKGWTDAWPLRILFVVLMVFIESLIVRPKYFLLWVSISIVGVDLACDIGQEFFLLPPYSYGNFSIGVKSAFNFHHISGEAYLNSTCCFPFLVISFIARKKRLYGILVSLLLLLSWVAGFMFANSYYDNSEEYQHVIFLTASILGCFAGILTIWSNYVYNKTLVDRKKLFLQRLSVICWTLVGIIPGLMGLGWKYIIFVAGLPPIAIYYFFEWKARVENKK